MKTLKVIPAHRQSSVAKMDCHFFYVEDQIKGKHRPSSLESARGNQIHHTMAQYAAHCKRRQVSMDLEAFEQFRSGAGPHAAQILAGLRDGYEVDYAHLAATEVTMSLDDRYRPVQVAEAIAELVEAARSNAPASFTGTLDTLYLFPEKQTALVDDYKSHPRPFLPEDPNNPNHGMQSIEYAVFVFMHFEWVEHVRFRLIFVRYQNCSREVTYHREDLPRLLEALRASRQLQLWIHSAYEAGREIAATPGPHCFYCPLLGPRSCPIAEYNETMQLTPQDRLRFYIWYAQFARVNTKVLASYVQATGRAVVVADGNGRPYKYGPTETRSKVYPVFTRDISGRGLAMGPDGRPLLPVIERLMDHAHSTPLDTEWMLKLTISASKMSRALESHSRVFLDQSLSDEVCTETKAPLRVSRPVDPEEEEEFEYEDEDDEE